MSLRSAHGRAASLGSGPRVEVLPVDELPAPVPAPDAPPGVPLSFRQDGKFGDPETARELGRRGGLARARKVRLVDSLGLSKLVEGTAFGPYRASAEEFVTHHLAQLAEQAGGTVSAAPSTMVASAALQLAASRWAFDQGAEKNDAALMKLGSTFANDSRQNLLAAYELATREAQARPRGPVDPLAAFMPKGDADGR